MQREHERICDWLAYCPTYLACISIMHIVRDTPQSVPLHTHTTHSCNTCSHKPFKKELWEMQCRKNIVRVSKDFSWPLLVNFNQVWLPVWQVSNCHLDVHLCFILLLVKTVFMPDGVGFHQPTLPTHTHKIKFSCPACAVNLVYHMLQFVATVPSQGASTEARPFYGRHSQYGAYRYL